MRLTISIIGLGWYGFPLAKFLQEKGHYVKGSTTTLSKISNNTSEGISSVRFNLMPHATGDDFQYLFDCDVLIVNIPPAIRQHGPDFHVQQIQELRKLAEAGGVKKLIYTSSTSVYPEGAKEYNEEHDFQSQGIGNETLYRAEKVLQESSVFSTTILRFGGLMGFNRIPGKYLHSSQIIEGDAPVNYVHIDDAIGVTYFVIEHGLWGNVFNIVSPVLRTRKEIYSDCHERFGHTMPIFSTTEGTHWKRVLPQKIQRQGYQFIHSDPLAFPYKPI